MLTNSNTSDRFDAVNIAGAVSAGWASRHARSLGAHDVTARFCESGEALAEMLASDWTIGLVILDLALATPELVARLGPSGPRLLAFGNPANAGLALAANLADFIPESISPDALLGAIHAAVAAPQRAGVADMSDRSAARLGALGEEAERITAALARLDAPSSAGEPSPVDLAVVRALIRARRARERYFPVEILADPGWDMLLDLTAARVERRAVSVSSLCIAAGVPTTTALRWIRNLCDSGLFERRNDPNDARRAFIGLGEPAAAAMAMYLANFALPGS